MTVNGGIIPEGIWVLDERRALAEQGRLGRRVDATLEANNGVEHRGERYSEPFDIAVWPPARA